MAAAIHGVYAEGLENGQRVMLLEMLESFFGPLSAKARRCIAEASPKQVKSWALAVPVAARDGKGIDDVLNGSAR